MKNQFVNYQTAKELKELEFNEPCIATYDQAGELTLFDYEIRTTNKLLCPLFQQVTQWLREEHKIFIGVHLYGNSFKQSYIGYTIENLNPNNEKEVGVFDTYPEALQAAINQALTIVKNKRK